MRTFARRFQNISAMKKLFLILAVLAGMTACTNGSGNGKSTEADSIYTWENIRKSMMEEPEHAFGLIDTAEMRGLADVNQANWMRAQIYYESPKAEDLDKARDLLPEDSRQQESRGRQSLEAEDALPVGEHLRISPRHLSGCRALCQTGRRDGPSCR